MARKSARKVPRRRMLTGILPTIGMLLLTSAILRVSLDATAFAEAAGQAKPHESSSESTAQTTELDGLIAVLKKRESDLVQREKELLARVKAAEVAETTIRDQLKKLELAEKSLREKIQIADTGAQEDVAQLTEVYARMKPKNAAALFSQMEPAFAAGFLAKMNADAAAAILAGMEPDTAYSISVVLAGRNANRVASGE